MQLLHVSGVDLKGLLRLLQETQKREQGVNEIGGGQHPTTTEDVYQATTMPDEATTMPDVDLYETTTDHNDATTEKYDATTKHHQHELTTKNEHVYETTEHEYYAENATTEIG